MLSCLMAAVSEQSRLQKRYLSLSLSLCARIFCLVGDVGLICLIVHSALFIQLEMEDGDEIDAKLHQTGGPSQDNESLLSFTISFNPDA